MTVKDIPAVDRALKREFKAHAAPIIELIEAQTHDPFCVLVGTILSARTKDACTAGAVKRLFNTEARRHRAFTAESLERLSQRETISSKPAAASLLMTCSNMGFPATGTIALGVWSVRGLRRVPKPAANIIAFIRWLLQKFVLCSVRDGLIRPLFQTSCSDVRPCAGLNIRNDAVHRCIRSIRINY